MSALESLILGIIQGLTEFLPVSSSGHLELVKAIFGKDYGQKQSLLKRLSAIFATKTAPLSFTLKKFLPVPVFILGLIQ